jgi:hypothetical protein
MGKQGSYVFRTIFVNYTRKNTQYLYKNPELFWQISTFLREVYVCHMEITVS